jgi:hypothetical protein
MDPVESPRLRINVIKVTSFETVIVSFIVISSFLKITAEDAEHAEER